MSFVGSHVVVVVVLDLVVIVMIYWTLSFGMTLIYCFDCQCDPKEMNRFQSSSLSDLIGLSIY